MATEVDLPARGALRLHHGGEVRVAAGVSHGEAEDTLKKANIGEEFGVQ